MELSDENRERFERHCKDARALLTFDPLTQTLRINGEPFTGQHAIMERVNSTAYYMSPAQIEMATIDDWGTDIWWHAITIEAKKYVEELRQQNILKVWIK